MAFFEKVFKKRKPRVEINEEDKSGVEICVESGDKWPKLVQALAVDNFDLRVAAVKRLGEIGDTKCIDLLIDCLKDKDDGIRCGAVEALGKIGDGRATEPLKVALEDAYRRLSQVEAEIKLTEDPEFRELSMMLIGELRNSYIPSIENTLRKLGK